jgi:hypothetical protein
MTLDKAETAISAGFLKRKDEFETLGTCSANQNPATKLHR